MTKISHLSPLLLKAKVNKMPSKGDEVGIYAKSKGLVNAKVHAVVILLLSRLPSLLSWFEPTIPYCVPCSLVYRTNSMICHLKPKHLAYIVKSYASTCIYIQQLNIILVPPVDGFTRFNL